MMADKVDRELLRQQRKIRKKEKKEARKLEKQQEKDKHVLQLERNSAKISVITTKPNDTTTLLTDKNFPSLTESGLGKNKHVKSNMPTQVPLENFILKEPKQPQKQKVECTKPKTSTYIGNRLDSSQPLRYQGKHREEPKKKRPSRLKSEICMLEQQRRSMPEQELITYCDNIVSDELKESTVNFIKRIVELQDKAYQKNPEKFKRRYVIGFHEVKKYLIVKKVKILMIADDLKIFTNDEPLYKTIQELVELAKNGEIPYVYCLKRSKIGNLTKKNRPVSCIAVLNHQGAEEEFGLVLKRVERKEEEESDDSKNDYVGLLEALKD